MEEGAAGVCGAAWKVLVRVANYVMRIADTRRKGKRSWRGGKRGADLARFQAGAGIGTCCDDGDDGDCEEEGAGTKVGVGGGGGEGAGRGNGHCGQWKVDLHVRFGWEVKRDGICILEDGVRTRVGAEAGGRSRLLGGGLRVGM